jgi:ABC-type transport system involved in multi-copper enzyme maturation permease subunit
MTTSFNELSRTSTAGGAFAAEWTKLRTLRSTWTTVIGAAVMSVALAFIVAANHVSQWDDMSRAQRTGFDALSATLVGVLLAAVIIGSLGVRSVTSEYSTGMIRLTFAAVPARRRVIAAKAAIIAGLAFPAVLASNLIAFVAGQRVLSAKDADVSLSHAGSVRAIFLGAVAVSVIAVIGVGLGSLVKQTAAATTALSVAIIGSQLFGVAVPEGARRFLPGTALEAVVSSRGRSDLLAPVAGLITLSLYAAIAITLATVLVNRRDA